jgi:serine-type D-Ala-D-Ala carboxypeptidase/endopeptidase (penicillin-binding protein 4)
VGLPAVLLVVVIGAGALAVQEERSPRPPAPIAASAVVTPVLSARRVPELLAAPVADRRLHDQLTELLSRTPGVSCLTVAASGRQVFAVNPSAPMMPASLEKLVTATAALDVLGPDTTLATSVKMANGRLYLIGGGDPVIMTDAYAASFEHAPTTRTSLETLADRIVAAGVKAVPGSVVGDDSRYDAVRYSPLWPQRFVDNTEIGPMSALTVDDGLVQFPPNPHVDLPKEEPAPDPAALAAQRLTDLLRARGVAVGGSPASGRAPADATDVVSLPSPPVKDLVAEMLRESDNLTAELLTKEIGRRASGAGTTQAGLAAITQDLSAHGLPTDGTSEVDGSGLATQDRVTCGLVQAVLDRAGPTSVIGQGLPVAGQTGTLEKRFQNNPAAGRLRAKTGTLRQVTALAGFVDSVPGSRLSFSFIVNLQAPAAVTPADVNLGDELGAILVGYPQGPDVAKLAPVAVG